MFWTVIHHLIGILVPILLIYYIIYTRILRKRLARAIQELFDMTVENMNRGN